MLSVIRIGIDPEIHLGPVTLAWHGLTIAIGILVGGLAAAREARRRGLNPEHMTTLGMILVIAALVGGRIFYLAEHDLLSDPGEWLGTTGFTFDGGFILAAVGIALYLRLRRLSVGYLDAIAVGLPLGVAIGRIGDVINGEHYGPATTFFLGVQNTHPDALVPSPDVAYHSGGLYEVILATIIFAIVWPLRRRLQRPTAMTWLVLGLFSLGRFIEFFARSDSPEALWGLSTTQVTSLVLLAVSILGAAATLRAPRKPSATSQDTDGATSAT
jgi:phosphatidylglycerol:prolipoprotein diacylglycerol transferase